MTPGQFAKVQNASTLRGFLNEHTHRGRCGIDACQTFLNQETKYRIGTGTAVRRHAWKGRDPIPPWKYHQSLWLIPCLKVKKRGVAGQTVKFVKSFNGPCPDFAANEQKQKGIERFGRFFRPVCWTSAGGFP
ncbi:hypothetical protein [Agrobacterium genomosp. 2]|uniref:hypothetical protein n=1 Tax=Agrobacterium genomosp. 2 TaxID=1183409 RepID=UPI00142DAD6A|nr:hypothetical protein [Agrobacterium genomosp. 2]